jgi:outer membrane protein OmpA-like peptidoglycan-associated protein
VIYSGLKSQDCDFVEYLFQNGAYQEAYAILRVLDQEPCTETDEFQMLKAEIFAANFRFEEALFILNRLDGKPELRELVKAREERIHELISLSKELTGTRTKYDSIHSSESRDLIAFSFANKLSILQDSTYYTSHFPVDKRVEGRFFIDSELGWSLKFNTEAFQQLGAGTVYKDSLLFLSVVRDAFRLGRGENFFEINCFDLNTGSRIKSLDLAFEDGNAIHPTVYKDTLYFASDIAGGHGGMDLWKMALQDINQETKPINLDFCNTAFNEIYPQWMGDSLIFSSNREGQNFGGYDLFSVSPKSPKKIRNLGYPINTPSNEWNPMVLEGEWLYFVTDRGEVAAKEDVWKAKFDAPELFFSEIIGRIQSPGTSFSGKFITLRSEDGEFEQKVPLDQEGYFKLMHIKGMEGYEIIPPEADFSESTKLLLFNESGSLIKEVKMRETGVFRFEILAPQDYFLEKMQNTDDSVLAIDIFGKVAPSTGNDDGLTIYLEDGNGELIGVTKTAKDGSFVFKSMKPDEKYTIRTDVTNPSSEIHILDDQGSVIQTIEPGKGNSHVYVRLSDANRIITITNQADEVLKVSSDESFSLPVINYALDSYELENQDRTNLNQVVDIMSRNRDLKLEVSAHTDSRGGDDYNLKLSQKRADQVIAYLVSSGISSSRLKGIGFGETKLLNTCDNNTECTEEEHRMNRRTELRFFESSE